MFLAKLKSPGNIVFQSWKLIRTAHVSVTYMEFKNSLEMLWSKTIPMHPRIIISHVFVTQNSHCILVAFTIDVPRADLQLDYS